MSEKGKEETTVYIDANTKINYNGKVNHDIKRLPSGALDLTDETSKKYGLDYFFDYMSDTFQGRRGTSTAEDVKDRERKAREAHEIANAMEKELAVRLFPRGIFVDKVAPTPEQAFFLRARDKEGRVYDALISAPEIAGIIHRDTVFQDMVNTLFNRILEEREKFFQRVERVLGRA